MQTSESISTGSVCVFTPRPKLAKGEPGQVAFRLLTNNEWEKVLFAKVGGRGRWMSEVAIARLSTASHCRLVAQK